MARPQRIRLGDVLVAQKLISVEQLNLSLERQKKSGKKLGRVLLEEGFASDEQIAAALAQQLKLVYVDLKSREIDAKLARKLPDALARRFRAIVLAERENDFLVGVTDPTDLFAFDEITRALGKGVELAVVGESALAKVIDQTYRRTAEIRGLVRALEKDVKESYVDFGAASAELGAEDAPVVKLLQSVFEDAVQINASDVHVEPQEARVQIRFRIDGALILQTESNVRVGPALVQRLKLMAGLDISERRLPQDGRLNVLVREKPIDVRMSTMPTQFGESVVLRLLNKSTGLQKLDSLGMPAGMLGRLREIIKRTTGTVLVTGPTGSGKTTTLYAALSEANTIDRKIITVEDPVEYRLAGVNQVQVNEKIDLSFARVLRSTLRQDPDIILVGEIRDQETAQIALRAALTGHLVFSTLHTKDAMTTPIRLIDMGAPAYMVATALEAVIAQRLVRKICESCAEPHVPDEREARWMQHVLGEAAAPGALSRGRGCSHCHNTGYSGRIGVYEMLDMTPELVAAASAADANLFISAASRQIAGHTLTHHAVERALAGTTTIAEAIKVSTELED
jgi:MSHA biogenesis protein MshE